jgi:DNA-binding NtrC family response regulator
MTFSKGGSIVAGENLLEGKKVLVVDDEPDVLETLKELLPMCHVKGADSFKKAKELLETQHFDMAILDIMGVDGYRLLKVANSRDVITVMFTAHALSPENVIKAYKKGAASYIPKEEMADIATFLNDILEAKNKGEHSWGRWLERFGSFFNKRFGPDWRDKYKEFWTTFPPD